MFVFNRCRWVEPGGAMASPAGLDLDSARPHLVHVYNREAAELRPHRSPLTDSLNQLTTSLLISNGHHHVDAFSDERRQRRLPHSWRI